MALSNLLFKISFTPPLKVATLTPDNSLAFHHEDHLSGANVTTDPAGTVLELADYYPYGEVRLEEKSNNYQNDYLFTGQERDEETGLMYYGARYYDPKVGRFMAVDPWEGELKDPQSLNKYAYVRNNPLKYVDPTGMFWEELGQKINEARQGIADSQRKMAKFLNNASSYVKKEAGGIIGNAGAMVTSSVVAAFNASADLYDPNTGGVTKAVAIGSLGLEVGSGGSGKVAKEAVEKIVSQTKQEVSAVFQEGFDILKEKTQASLNQMENLDFRQIAPTDKTPFRDASYKAELYGGKAEDYIKYSSPAFKASDGMKFEIHSIKNKISGSFFELKTKILNWSNK